MNRWNTSICMSMTTTTSMRMKAGKGRNRTGIRTAIRRWTTIMLS